MFSSTSTTFVGFVLWSADCAGRFTSPTSHVSVPPVVAPDVLLERKTRPVVFVVDVAAVVAVGLQRTRVTNDPFVPAVHALKMSVAMVPVPSDFVFAAVTATTPTFGVSVKIGLMFAGTYPPEGRVGGP